MKLLKGFLIAISGLFIVITLFSLLMPSNVLTVRSVTINVPHEKIMQQLQDLQQWKNWHPFFKAEKNITISVPSSGFGAYAEWYSSDRKEHLQITEVLPNSIRLSMRREGDNELLNKITLTNFKDSNNIQVEWSALTKLKWYPWEKFSGIFIDKITGPGYETALKDLKAYLEQ